MAIRRAGSWRRCCSGRKWSWRPRESGAPCTAASNASSAGSALEATLERRRLGKLLGGRRHIERLARKILGDRAPERRVCDVVGRISQHRAVAARELVLALRAGLDARQPVRDRVLDRLVVAELEMQERMVLDAAPVAAEEGFVAAE